MNILTNEKTDNGTTARISTSQRATIPEFFYSAGICHHRVAGRIFMEAVFMAAEDLSHLKNISRNIYAPIARRHGTTVGNVSKNMRDVRDTIMKHDGEALLAEMTGSRCWYAETPYPHEIIEVFARYVRDQKIPHDVL
ncbi:MAG: hypothetical protein HFI64_01390 [Lachnospiraceae bacterium]|nr:hypothetical protein [Lachnospiraceae bacterium]